MLSCARPTRRQVLAGLGGVVATACAKRETQREAPRVVVPFAQLPSGERVRVEVNGRPVELVRAASGSVTARSLLCTHQGCEVVWVPEESVYACPCHEGRFDPDGRVAAGPPTAPLGTLRVEVRGTDAVVGG